MRKKLSRLLAFILAVSVTINSLPLAVFATVEPTTPDSQVTEIVEGGQATPEVSAEPSVEPSAEPEVEPSVEPSAEPTEEDSDKGLLMARPPMSSQKAEATPNSKVAVFGSDVHGDTTQLNTVLAGVASGVKPAVVGFLGDTMLKMATVSNSVNTAFGYNPEIVYVYAPKHDNPLIDYKAGDCDIGSAWDKTGQVYAGEFYIYTIRETDIDTDTTAEKDFTQWIEKIDKTKPVFVISHRPLHERRDDNPNANDWYDAINAAASSVDIVFFWGHNHYEEADVDIDAYYVSRDGDDTFPLDGGKTANPDFTYVNAGYIDGNDSVYGNHNIKRRGIVTAVEVTDDAIILQDYCATGKYTDTYSHNVTISRNFATSANAVSSITVTAPTKTEYLVGDTLDTTGLEVMAVYSDGTTVPVTDFALSSVDMSTAGDKTVTVTYQGKTAQFTITVTDQPLPDDVTVSQSGVSITAPGITAVTVTVKNENPNPEIYTAYITYDITPEGYTQGHPATVTVPVPDTFDALKPVQVIYNGSVIAYTNIVDGTVTFTTDHFTEYAIAQTDGIGTITATGNLVGGLQLRDTPASSLEDGKGYVIVTDYGRDATLTGNHNPANPSDWILLWLDYDKNHTADVRNINYIWYADKTGNGNTEWTFRYGSTNGEYIYVAGSGNNVSLGRKYFNYNSSDRQINRVESAGTNDAGEPVFYIYNYNGSSSRYLERKDSEKGDCAGSTSNRGNNTKWKLYEVYQASGAPVELSVTPDSSYVITGNTMNLATAVTVDGKNANTYTLVWSSSDTTKATVDSNGVVTGLADGTVTITATLSKANGENLESPIVLPITVNVSTTHEYYVKADDITTVAQKDAVVELTSKLYDKPSNSDEIDITDTPGYTVSYEVVTTKGNPGVIKELVGDKITLSGEKGKVYVTATYRNANNDIVATKEIAVNAGVPHHYSVTLHKAELEEVTGLTAETFEPDKYYTFDPVENRYTVATEFVEGQKYYSSTFKIGDVIDKPVPLKGVEAGDEYAVWAVVKAHASEDDIEGIDLGRLGDALQWAVSNEAIATINPVNGLITFTGADYGDVIVTVVYKCPEGEAYASSIKLSVSKDEYIVPGDGTNDFPQYPEQGSVRFNKTATAVGTYARTGLSMIEMSMTGVPYTTESGMDVVLMLDHSNSMTDDRMKATRAAVEVFIKNIVMNEDGSFNNNRIYVASFAGGNPAYSDDSTHDFRINKFTTNESDGYQIINDQTELTALINTVNTGFVKPNNPPFGTEYDKALEDCYKVLKASKEDGNKQFCVFMSDGIPNVYRKEDNTTLTSTNAITAMFSTANGVEYSNRNSSGNNKYYYEYWSTKMKDEGITVFTVGLGLNTANNSSSLTAANTERIADRLLNDISGPANESVRDTGTQITKKGLYFFSVKDTDAAAAMSDVFSAIATKITEAATNVRVEDKIGNHYTVNFSMPEGVGIRDTNGVDEFYMQAVEYTLNSDKERVGEPRVIENFTFNSAGQFVKHTVDGVTCNNCDHYVAEYFTFTEDEVFVSHTINGVLCENCTHYQDAVPGVKISKITGKYFQYEDKGKAEGEYINWAADKLTSSELALQYFAYLDGSASHVGQAGATPAGTYYTNEYATLTYKNYQENEVQQYFPRPKLVWNGAQISYTFYLVNADGQPVNRAGRVVPFAEAVYITDVFTEEMVWNDLEKSESLTATFAAKDHVPSVFKLYDPDAVFKIHVYEDEAAVNMNNHFKIESKIVEDDDPETEATTTYVFNNKSDAVKYNENGIYVANDGDDNTEHETFLCKGEGTLDVTWAHSGKISEETFKIKPHFIEVNGIHVLAEEYDPQQNYCEFTVATYTLNSAAGEEEQWKPGTGANVQGGTIINGYVYYVDENGAVYTIVRKSGAKEVHKGFDFNNATVAFAVHWEPVLAPDTVVLDYGLDVLVDVTSNDLLMNGGVTGISFTDDPFINLSGIKVVMNEGYYLDKRLTRDVLYTTDGLFKISLESNNKIRFHQDEIGFKDPITIYYESAVNYPDPNHNNETTRRYMYSSVTAIPATTIYYEDDFVYFTSYSNNGDGYKIDDESRWITTAQRGVQEQDRPDKNQISRALDADNNYGYDSAYTQMSTYSMGSAAHITVDAKSYGVAEFSFYGTGFDVIGVTSNQTGTITVQVIDENGSYIKNAIVDTYYGMSSDGTLVPNTPDTLYQVPVMKMSGLAYGRYTVKITAAYARVFDHTGTSTGVGSTDYDLYIDAIRIYDPCGDVTQVVGKDKNGKDITVSDVYVLDGEGWPSYQELRNHIIKASEYEVTEKEDGSVEVTAADTDTGEGSDTDTGEGSDTDTEPELPGAIFIDCANGTSTLADYISYGPNNELYLAPNQAIAFSVDTTNVADIQLALKVLNNTPVTYEISYPISSSPYVAKDSFTVSTSTDLYYSILKYAQKGVVTIKNASAPTVTETEKDTETGTETTTAVAPILSITNIKTTYKQAPAQATMMKMSPLTVGMALMSLRPPVEEPEPTPEPTPEVTPAPEAPSTGTAGTTTPSVDATQTTDKADTDSTGTAGEVAPTPTPEAPEPTPEAEEETSVEEEKSLTLLEIIINFIKAVVKAVVSFFSKLFG